METVTSSPRRWWALVAIVLSILTIGFDATILNVALPTLATSLDASTGELQWIVDAYILVFAGLLLPMGALGDRYGRKRFLLLGLLLFAGASVLALYAEGAGQVIAARALMGVGAAVLTPITLAVLPVLFAPSERPRAIAATTMGMGLGLPLGPIIGGYLLDHFWWGSIFLINVPVAVLAMLAVAALVPESKARRPKRVDLPGGVLSVAGLVLLVYAVIEAPVRGWGAGVVLGTLAGGLLLLVAFVLVERRSADPMIDLALFRRSRFGWGSAAATAASFVLFGLLFVVPQYLQAVLGHDAFGVGVRLLPLIGGLFVGAPLGVRLAGWIGAKVPVAAGLAVGAGGLLLGAGTDVGHGFGFAATWLAITGLGIGVAMTPAMNAVLGELPVDEAGSGTAVTMTVRQVGGALGVALLGSVSAAVYEHQVPDVAADSVAAGLAVARRLGDAALVGTVRAGYVEAMDVVLLVCAAVAALGGLLVALFLPAAPATAAPDARESADELTRVA